MEEEIDDDDRREEPNTHISSELEKAEVDDPDAGDPTSNFELNVVDVMLETRAAKNERNGGELQAPKAAGGVACAASSDEPDMEWEGEENWDVEEEEEEDKDCKANFHFRSRHPEADCPRKAEHPEHRSCIWSALAHQ